MINTMPLLAFGFGNLAMLGWLAAAAAPLLIHLWSRRRYREVPWAAVAFLLAAVRKNSRRIQLQQWLLLAVRTLIILLVVLALAEPYGRGLAGNAGGGPTHKLLVIDTSLSMACHDGDLSRLERAKTLAIELIERSGAGDVYSLVTLADPPRQVPLRNATDRNDVVAQVNAITQTDGRANLAATLDTVADALELEHPQSFVGDEVYFFTDLQRVTWKEAQVTATSEPGRPRPRSERATPRLASLAERVALMAIDVGSPCVANLAVTDLSVRDPFITVGREVVLEATLHEFGEQPRENLVVELLVDESPVREQTVDVPAGGDATVRFTHRFRDTGSHIVAVRTAAEDRLAVDNMRYLVADVAERVDVLIVAGRRADGRYLADALDPDPADRSALRPRIISEGELADTELTPYACVFLSNVAQLTASEASRLAEYVEQGGGLVVFLGDRVIAESYNTATEDGRLLLPARLGEVRAESRFGIDPLDYKHPIVAPFRGQERAGLLSTPIARYVQLDLSDDAPQTEVAITMSGGDPLVVTAPFGNGRIVMVATAASLSSVDAASSEPWTAWPAWPSFLPIVRTTLAYAVGSDGERTGRIVGDPIGSKLAPESLGATDRLELIRPDGRSVTVHATPATAGHDWRYSDTDVSGIYTLRDSDGGGVQRFAVNADTWESDLTQLALDRLPPELAVQTNLGASHEYKGDMLAAVAWHRPLLWAALSLVFVELCLVWLFGRGGR